VTVLNYFERSCYGVSENPDQCILKRTVLSELIKKKWIPKNFGKS
jgi:hypothetical protein